MSDRSQDMLCKALEMAVNAVSFYEQTLGSCSSSMSREVFDMLRKDKAEHMDRIKAIHEGLTRGETWSGVCVLEPEDRQEARAIVSELVAKYSEQSCPATEEEALKSAIDMEDKLAGFYQDQVAKADDDVEKAFLEHMVGESRAHFMLLKDTQDYYQDPAGWAMLQEKSGLDGA